MVLNPKDGKSARLSELDAELNIGGKQPETA